MKFSIKDFFRKCDQISWKTAGLVTFTEEILNEKLHFLFNAKSIEMCLKVRNFSLETANNKSSLVEIDKQLVKSYAPLL